jgi:purine-nucleoside/S-methyl-5'-thioadenosine phosphorylase / adenosine deaminase
VFAWRTFAERADAAPGAYLTAPSLERAGVRVAFTTRHGGVSGEPFATLNLSYVSGDDAELVRANRARALASIGLGPDAWTGGRQVHARHVERVDEERRGAGADSAADTIPGTDALWTERPGIALVVLVADCVPVVLADLDRRRVAVVHAGWRGLVAGVIEAAADAMGAGKGTVALAGPSIGPCCYEVSDDVAGPATERFGAAVMRGSNLDLWAGAGAALRTAGVTDASFAALCTRCEPDRFFSHRAGSAARQGLVACLA